MSRSRSATAATISSSNVSVPTWLSNGDVGPGRQRERVARRHRQRRQRSVGAGDDRVAGVAGERHGVEQPALVTAQVDDDERRARRAEGELAAHGDVVAGRPCSTPSRSAPRSWTNCCATPCSASPASTRTGRLQIAEQGDDRVEGVAVDVVERLGDVGHGVGPVPLDVRAVGELADPLGGRAQLPGEIVLHRRLQRS